MYYRLFIWAVDDETFFSIGTCNKAAVLGFLETYDHEGSSVGLEVFADADATSAPLLDLNGEEAFAVLRTPEPGTPLPEPERALTLRRRAS